MNSAALRSETSREVVRGPLPCPIATLPLSSNDELLLSIGAIAAGRPWIVADLSLGSWRGHFMAWELSRQLDLEPPRDDLLPPLGLEHTAAGQVDAIGALIDRESTSDVNRDAAHRHAARIATAVLEQDIAAVFVVAPLGDASWESEDLWLMRLLASALAQTSSTLVVITSATLPPGFEPVRLQLDSRSASPVYCEPVATPCASMPGILPADGLRSAVADATLAIVTPTGFRWIPPQRRDADRSVLLGDETERAQLPGWLRAYAQCFATPALRDTDLLRREAALRFAEGGYRIALRLLDAALEGVVDSSLRGALQSQAQAMRIAMLDFAGAAAQDFELEDTAEEFRGPLALAKAWGLVMTQRPQAAEPLFELAAARQQSVDARFELYLLNIRALNQLRLGKFDVAFALEMRIQESLQARAQPDWQLTYVNAINLARLHRIRRDHTRAREQYLRAFAINAGLRSQSDQVYFNLCLAKLEEAPDRPQADALLLYLRAALHWLAMRAPEALAPRVVLAMLERGEHLPADPVEPVSRYLHACLARLIERLAIPCIGRRSALGFAHVADMPAASDLQLRAIGARGWGLLYAPIPAPQRCLGEAYQRLRELIIDLLMYLQPCWNPPPSGTVLLDDQFGVELPVNGAELLQTAVRLDCREVLFAEHSVILSEQQRQQIEQHSVVRLGLGVDGLLQRPDEVILTFRRYLAPAVLTGTAAAIVPLAREGIALHELADALQMPASEVLVQVRELEQQHLLRLLFESPAVEAPAVSH